MTLKTNFNEQVRKYKRVVMCCYEGEEITLLCLLRVIYTWLVCSLSINIVMKERPADTEDSTHNTGHSTNNQQSSHPSPACP